MMNSDFNINNPQRISIFIGAYGSGKSEISVNYALWMHSRGHQVVLCDLDMINPYYRSADVREEMKLRNIRLIASRFAGTNVDVPSVPGDLAAAIDNESNFSVLDIGGEDLGARVLAALKNKFVSVLGEIAIYMVVNTCRPYTADKDQIVTTAHSLTDAAGMNLTGLVHNTNLMDEHSADLLEESWPVLRQAADELGVPVVFAAGKDAVLPRQWQGKTPYGTPLLRLGSYIRYADQK